MSKTIEANKLQILLPKIGGSVGGIYLQRVRCGKRSCRCKRLGESHEGYYYMFRDQKKLVKRYIPRDEVDGARSLLAQLKEKRGLAAQVSRASMASLRGIRDRLRENERQFEGRGGGRDD